MRTHGEGNDADAGTADDAGLKAAREYSELDCAGVLTTEAALFCDRHLPTDIAAALLCRLNPSGGTEAAWKLRRVTRHPAPQRNRTG